MKGLLGLTALAALCRASFLREDTSNAKRVEFLAKMREIDTQKRLSSHENDLHRELLASAVKVQRSADSPSFMRSLDEEYNYVGGGDQDDAVDLTEFALKYVGCQNIHQYDDNLAGNGKSPLAMNRFVILRLCPKDECSAYNNDGCFYNFGEYTVPMSDYLKIMSKYHVKQFGQYCSTCSLCMSFEVPDNYGDDVYGDDVANDDANGYRNLENNYDQYADDAYDQYGYYAANYQNDDGQYQYQNAYPWYVDANGQCIFESVCNGYDKTCSSYSENEAGYSDYFTCQQSVVGNKNFYTAPHCRSDGHTIGIGIYEDENCNTYVGKDFNFDNDQNGSNGLSFDDEDLKTYYDGNCISCQASDSYALVTDDAYGTQEYTYPLCSVLYDYSAKCNKRIALQSTYDYRQNDEYSQEENEEDVCEFIASLVEGNYDEYGEIYFGNSFRLSNWSDPEEYKKLSPMTVFGLVSSVLLFLIISVYTCVLRSRLTRRPNQRNNNLTGLMAPWKPFSPAKSLRIARQNSGIVQCRSMDSAAAEAQVKSANQSLGKGAFA